MCDAPNCPLLQAVLAWFSTGKRIGDVRREARKKELKMDILDSLSYEQMIALRILRDVPGKTGVDVCKSADCSFDELFRLEEAGMIELKEEQKCLYPNLTMVGRAVLSKAEREGII